MFDMSWGEIMVIGGVALIVIGPKDLPKALRTVGQMTAKVRRMAGEFQSQFSDAMLEAELQDVLKEVEGLNRDVTAATSAAFNPIQTLREEIKGAGGAAGATEPKPAAAPEPDIWGVNPAPAAPAPEAGPAVPASAYEDVGPLPHAAPVTPAIPERNASIPEVQPPVPLPLDPPARTAPQPARPQDAA